MGSLTSDGSTSELSSELSGWPADRRDLLESDGDFVELESGLSDFPADKGNSLDSDENFLGVADSPPDGDELESIYFLGLDAASRFGLLVDFS